MTCSGAQSCPPLRILTSSHTWSETHSIRRGALREWKCAPMSFGMHARTLLSLGFWMVKVKGVSHASPRLVVRHLADAEPTLCVSMALVTACSRILAMILKRLSCFAVQQERKITINVRILNASAEASWSLRVAVDMIAQAGSVHVKSI